MASHETYPEAEDSPLLQEVAEAEDRRTELYGSMWKTHTRRTVAISAILLMLMFVSGDVAYMILNYKRSIAAALTQLNNAAWIPLTGILSEAIFQPVFGYAATKFDRPRPLQCGTLLLVTAFFICACSRTLWQILLARFIFGAGSASVHLLATITITDVVPLSKLALWRSIIVVFESFGLIFGGPIWTSIASSTNWSMPFAFEGALSLLGFFMMFSCFPRSFRLWSQNQPNLMPSAKSSQSLDIYGIILLPLAILCPVGAIAMGQNTLKYDHPVVIILAVISVPLLLIFIYVEARVAAYPILPLELFRCRQSATVLICTAMTIWARNQLDIHIAFYADVRAGEATQFTKWILTFQFIGVSLGTMFSGAVVARSKRLKWCLLSGIFAETVLFGTLAVGWLAPDEPRFAPTLVLLGVGLGIIQNCLITALLNFALLQGVSFSMAYAVFEMMVSISAECGIAVSSAVQQQRFVQHMYHSLGASPETTQLIESSLQSLEFVYKLKPSVREGVLRCFVEATQDVFATSSLLLMVSGFLTMFIDDLPVGLKKDQECARSTSAESF